MQLREYCNFCQSKLEYELINLGRSPLANAILTKEQLLESEKYYPLSVFCCNNCYLVQLKQIIKPQAMFSDYNYMSSVALSYKQHVTEYIKSLENHLTIKSSNILEIASNDGYLLSQLKSAGGNVLGVDPAENLNQKANDLKINTITDFFTYDFAKNLDKKFDLIIANNVLAHVPDLNNFIAGLKVVLNQAGIITIEFPHLMQLLQNNQFDTIYHEHDFYLSLTCLVKIFAANDLSVYALEELDAHGGSLRLYLAHFGAKQIDKSVTKMLELEQKNGITKLEYYNTFKENTLNIKNKLLSLLLDLKLNNKRVAAYGAAAKGNTLLNYCNISSDLISYVVDKSELKQNHYTPGTNLPIVDFKYLLHNKPDYLLLLPWNLKTELIDSLKDKLPNTKFIVAIPRVEIINAN